MPDFINQLVNKYKCSVTFVSDRVILVYYQETEFTFKNLEEVENFKSILDNSVLID